MSQSAASSARECSALMQTICLGVCSEPLESSHAVQRSRYSVLISPSIYFFRDQSHVMRVVLEEDNGQSKLDNKLPVEQSVDNMSNRLQESGRLWYRELLAIVPDTSSTCTFLMLSSVSFVRL